jgi:DNA-binding response OmpR family regulator
MKRVLLVYDDFNELTLMESQLKRVGFDAYGLSSELQLSDQILNFRPDILVVMGRNSRVSTLSVGQKMRNLKSYQGKVILIQPPGTIFSPQDLLKVRMDLLLSAPVPADKLIVAICKVLSLDAQVLLEKWTKVNRELPARKAPAAIGQTADETLRAQRKKRYDEFLKAQPPLDSQHTEFDRANVKSHLDQLKKDFDYSKLDEIDRLKREFAEALFRKTKS